MDIKECRKERFSSRSLGLVVLVVALVLFAFGLLIVPVVGFVFSVPLLILALTMIAAPESRACRLIREGLHLRS
jgi:hypothetical protein